MNVNLAALLWKHRGALVAGPWQHKPHPSGDCRGIWYRLDLHGHEVAWLEAPSLKVPRTDAEGNPVIDAKTGAQIIDDLSVPLRLIDAGDMFDPFVYWPTLNADMAKKDEELRARGYLLLDAQSAALPDPVATLDRYIDSILARPSMHMPNAFAVEMLLLTLIEIRALTLGTETGDYKNGVARGRYQKWLHENFPKKPGALFLSTWLEQSFVPPEGERADSALSKHLADSMAPFIRLVQREAP